MILLELVEAVERVIQDSSFTDSDIIARLNEAQSEVSGGVQSTLGSWLTPPLPELLTIGTINTSTEAAYIAMPDNFQRTLQFVASSKGNEIDIAESFISFAEVYPLLDKSGAIVECCEAGKNFYYQGIPTSSAEITIHYYRFPVDMSSDADLPDGIPSHLHRGLLVNHVCWKIFELIEDGIDEAKTNTEKYMTLFFNAARILELFIPYEDRNFNLLK